jgi:hypothetical protein
MYIENNPLRLVRINDFYGKVLEDVEIKIKDIKDAYMGESFILTTSDEVYEQVFDMFREVMSDVEDSEEWIEEIKSCHIKNIEDYVNCVYEQEYYDILGVNGNMGEECENVMETLVDAFKRGKLSEEDLSEWEKLIDKTVKQHVMEYVADEVTSKVRKLKEEGYYIGELIDSLNKIK